VPGSVIWTRNLPSSLLGQPSLSTASSSKHRRTGNLVADFDVPLGALGLLTIGGDLSYRSRYFNDPNNTQLLAQDAYTLLGAHMRLRTANERWELTAFGTNLSDKRFKTNGLQSYGSFGTADATYGPPREWGLTVRARF
jgi:outer membrane receptor protein involved in Fe transport